MKVEQSIPLLRIFSVERARLRPGIEHAPWGADVLQLTDPFGNRLRFSEDGGATGDTG